MKVLFVDNLDIIYFFYGLAFLTLGMILLTQIRAAGKSKYKLLDILMLLALFALIHGASEFTDMYKLIKGDNLYVEIASLVLLLISYSLLFSFGYILVIVSGKKIGLWFPSLIAILYFGLPLLVAPGSFSIWDISARYFLGFSGSILSFAGLYFYNKKEPDRLRPVKKYLFIASISFGLYGVFGGLLVPKAGFFPASIINNSSFTSLTGFPPQLFRASFTVLITWSMWHTINIFNLEKETERLRVLETLKLERDKAKNYLELAGVMILAIDKHRKVILINKEGTNILRYPEKDIVGKDWLTFVPENIKSNVKSIFNELLKGNIDNIERYEYPIINKLGQKRIIFWHNTLIKDDSKSVVGIISSGEDITEKKIAVNNLKKSVKKLKQNLEETVHVLASIVETKDSYTSDHQKRVAQLATAIAKEIGLSEEQVEGVYVSAILHDIGKLFIPAEILNKPNRLTDLELNLVKSHCQSGYDILKSVDFPWPVAKIIFQHHERINGSGYPCGLIDNQISLEAKIIAVADVVEAISSHRPYRPAMGLDAALIEISQNSGILYNKKIADACIKLFNVKKFNFGKDKDKLMIQK